MNNTPGNAQRQGAEPRRASTLNAISSPKPHFHCKHSDFWFAYRMRTIHMPKVNQKNRPFGLQPRIDMSTRSSAICTGSFATQSQSNKIYRKLGFETQRNFNYYSAKLSDIVPVLQVNHTACRILPSDLKNCLNQTAWFDFHPSWQNDRASLERGIDNLDILGAYEREELVGFVIFEPASGDISSLAVAKDYRRKGGRDHHYA